MALRVDCGVDRKKSRIENEGALFELFFARNINNHKIITKYVHSCDRMGKRLAQL